MILSWVPIYQTFSWCILFFQFNFIGLAWEFKFEVKFYPPDPQTLHEDLTRWVYSIIYSLNAYLTPHSQSDASLIIDK